MLHQPGEAREAVSWGNKPWQGLKVERLTGNQQSKLSECFKNGIWTPNCHARQQMPCQAVNHWGRAFVRELFKSDRTYVSYLMELVHHLALHCTAM